METSKSVVAGILLLLSIVGLAAAGALEEGDAAYSKGDYANAVRLLRPLADRDIALAQYRLAEMYSSGNGVPQDYAQYKLGTMYENGEGVPRDNILAYMWFDLSAAHGNKAGATRRDAIVPNMSREQLSEAQKLAGEWKPCTKWLWIFSRGNC